MTTTVTLTIVTRNRFEPTVETLLQVDLTLFDEIIIIDDSEDSRLQLWCENQPISYYQGPKHNRQAARNLAIEQCETELMAFVDDDVLLPTDFAKRIRDAFSRHPDAVAIGGPTLSNAPEEARDICYREKMAVNHWTGTVYDDSYRWIPDHAVEVGLLKGANMVLRRDVLEAIGGFDITYGGPAQREETDVCVRVADHGRILYDPELICFHKQTGGSEFTASHIEWRFKNHGYFVRKNFGDTVFLVGFLSLFARLCGNPESLPQLVFRRVVLRQQFSILRCLYFYLAKEPDNESSFS